MSRKIKWTEQLKDYIKANAEKMTDEEISKALSKYGQYFSTKAVRLQRQKMGIEKCRGRGVSLIKEIHID